MHREGRVYALNIRLKCHIKGFYFFNNVVSLDQMFNIFFPGSICYNHPPTAYNLLMLLLPLWKTVFFTLEIDIYTEAEHLPLFYYFCNLNCEESHYQSLQLVVSLYPEDNLEISHS